MSLVWCNDRCHLMMCRVLWVWLLWIGRCLGVQYYAFVAWSGVCTATLYDMTWHDICLMAILQVSRYQNVSILDFIEAKDDVGGGDNWSSKTHKVPVKLPPSTNQHPNTLLFTGRMPFLLPSQHLDIILHC